MNLATAIERADRDIATWRSVIKVCATTLAKDAAHAEFETLAHTIDVLNDAHVSLARAHAVREALGTFDGAQ